MFTIYFVWSFGSKNLDSFYKEIIPGLSLDDEIYTKQYARRSE